MEGECILPMMMGCDRTSEGQEGVVPCGEDGVGGATDPDAANPAVVVGS